MIGKLCDAVEALQKDKERLDWLEENSRLYPSAIEIDDQCFLDADNMPTLRAAIDVPRLRSALAEDKGNAGVE